MKRTLHGCLEIRNLSSPVEKIFHSFAALTREIFSTHKAKFCISLRPCNILYDLRLSYLFLGLVISSWWHWLSCISVCLSLSFNLLMVSLSLNSSRINATCLSCNMTWNNKYFNSHVTLTNTTVTLYKTGVSILERQGLTPCLMWCAAHSTTMNLEFHHILLVSSKRSLSSTKFCLFWMNGWD